MTFDERGGWVIVAVCIAWLLIATYLHCKDPSE